ncbi:CCA tRNA nucleotidyltransferase [Rhodobacterales bacterium HKCCE3408]|nr:CCA tRNA nucleotidyltransferase [Rhodobacterales bacterium HKCCE3408]
MKLSAGWMRHPGTRAVMDMLAGSGHRALFVGGCVRNEILGRPVADLDIATDAPPETVQALAEASGLKAVGTGIEHGTVTVVAEGRPHEVTTFRRDVETDGRRAVVAFSTRIEDDAMRRDFTMNALYAEADGTVLDPTGEGLRDAKARRLRFIGRAEDRIREDYLRTLRYFRFHAWYADPATGFDPVALAAISSLLGGLETLSAERVGHEMRRLLAAPDPAPAVATMAQAGVLRVVLPGASAELLPVLVHLEGTLDVPPDWTRRLAALSAPDAAERLRLARAEARDLALLEAAMTGAAGPGELGYRLGRDLGRSALLLRAAALASPPPPEDLVAVETGADATFPVRAADLPDLSGPELGQRLKLLEARWIASGFTLSRSDLLT